MERTSYVPYILIIVLMVLASLALAFTVDVSISDESGVRMTTRADGEVIMHLPDAMGRWTGEEIRFCQNQLCEHQFGVSQLEDLHICPDCGGKLGSMTLLEKEELPRDTQMIKKRYDTALEEENVFVAIVLSGRERSSIHRPQRCLIGQGNTIANSQVVTVELEDGGEVEVMVLDTVRNIRLEDGRELAYHGYYAYWFVGKGRETPHHLERMLWMASDRVFHNVSHKWAYLGIQGRRDSDNDNYLETVRTFVRHLHPEVVEDEG